MGCDLLSQGSSQIENNSDVGLRDNYWWRVAIGLYCSTCATEIHSLQE